jgi:hypothetical protein
MSEPTIVFVFDLKHWYTTITPLSKLDLFDIVPSVCVQFGFDIKTQAYVLVITRSKWEATATEIKKKFMTISRRMKEEMDGPMTTIQRDHYENADIFSVFDKKEEVSEPVKLEQVKEDYIEVAVPEPVVVAKVPEAVDVADAKKKKKKK